MENIERNDNVRVRSSGISPSIPAKPATIQRSSCCSDLGDSAYCADYLIGAAQSTVSALERNHTAMNSEALTQVTIPALVKIILMDAVTIIALLFLWLRRNWARIVSIVLSIFGALGGILYIYGSVILFNSVDVQTLSGAELAHFVLFLWW